MSARTRDRKNKRSLPGWALFPTSLCLWPRMARPWEFFPFSPNRARVHARGNRLPFCSGQSGRNRDPEFPSIEQVKDQSERLKRALVEVETAKHELELDILKRKEIEDALRESEARKTAVLQSALDCIVTIDQSGRILDFNPAAERTFGYSSAAAIGKDLAELMIPLRFRESHHRGLKRYLQADEGRIIGKRMEMTAIRADGTEFPIELSITRIDLERSLFTGYLRDITERKQAEESLRKAEEKYRFIFENAIEGIFQSTPEGRFLTVNPAMARMLGYDSPAELVSAVTNIEQQLYVEPERRQELKRLLADLEELKSTYRQPAGKDLTLVWDFSSDILALETDANKLKHHSAAPAQQRHQVH
jgi:PAS domain S-box-containing protein